MPFSTRGQAGSRESECGAGITDLPPQRRTVQISTRDEKKAGGARNPIFNPYRCWVVQADQHPYHRHLHACDKFGQGESELIFSNTFCFYCVLTVIDMSVQLFIDQILEKLYFPTAPLTMKPGYTYSPRYSCMHGSRISANPAVLRWYVSVYPGSGLTYSCTEPRTERQRWTCGCG